VTRYSLLALTALLSFGSAASAQQFATKSAAPSAATRSATQTKLAPPIRGDAKIEMTEPVAKNTGKLLITTFKVKNMEAGSIAGLRVDDLWFDKQGNPVTGSSFRDPKPLQPGEIIEVRLETPILDRSKMDRNQYVFKQANGNVKVTKVKKLP